MPMKLFYVHGTDDDDLEMNLDYFVVAEDKDAARELWRAAVDTEIRGSPGLDKEISGIRIILDDVTGTRYDFDQPRAVSWGELAEA